jgi:hypothetical protein
VRVILCRVQGCDRSAAQPFSSISGPDRPTAVDYLAR